MAKKKAKPSSSPHGDPDGIYSPRRQPFATVDELLEDVLDQPTLLETLDRISGSLRQILRLAREPHKAKLLAAFPWLQTLTGADPMDPEIQADAREASRRLQAVRGVVAMEVDELTLTRSQLLKLVKDAMALGRAVEWLHVRGFEEDVVVRRKAQRGRRDAITKRYLKKSAEREKLRFDYERRVKSKMAEFNITKTKAVDLVAVDIDKSPRHISNVLAGR